MKILKVQIGNKLKRLDRKLARVEKRPAYAKQARELTNSQNTSKLTTKAANLRTAIKEEESTTLGKAYRDFEYVTGEYEDSEKNILANTGSKKLARLYRKKSKLGAKENFKRDIKGDYIPMSDKWFANQAKYKYYARLAGLGTRSPILSPSGYSGPTPAEIAINLSKRVPKVKTRKERKTSGTTNSTPGDTATPTDNSKTAAKDLALNSTPVSTVTKDVNKGTINPTQSTGNNDLLTRTIQLINSDQSISERQRRKLLTQATPGNLQDINNIKGAGVFNADSQRGVRNIGFNRTAIGRSLAGGKRNTVSALAGYKQQATGQLSTESAIRGKNTSDANTATAQAATNLANTNAATAKAKYDSEIQTLTDERDAGVMGNADLKEKAEAAKVRYEKEAAANKLAYKNSLTAANGDAAIKTGGGSTTVTGGTAGVKSVKDGKVVNYADVEMNPSMTEAAILAGEFGSDLKTGLGGKPFIMTSSTDGVHSPGSKHYSGEAYDFRTKDHEEKDIGAFSRDLASKGYKVLYEEDADGIGHLHTEYVGKGNGHIGFVEGASVAIKAKVASYKTIGAGDVSGGAKMSTKSTTELDELDKKIAAVSILPKTSIVRIKLDKLITKRDALTDSLGIIRKEQLVSLDSANKSNFNASANLALKDLDDNKLALIKQIEDSNRKNFSSYKKYKFDPSTGEIKLRDPTSIYSGRDNDLIKILEEQQKSYAKLDMPFRYAAALKAAKNVNTVKAQNRTFARSVGENLLSVLTVPGIIQIGSMTSSSWYSSPGSYPIVTNKTDAELQEGLKKYEKLMYDADNDRVLGQRRSGLTFREFKTTLNMIKKEVENRKVSKKVKSKKVVTDNKVSAGGISTSLTGKALLAEITPLNKEVNATPLISTPTTTFVPKDKSTYDRELFSLNQIDRGDLIPTLNKLYQTKELLDKAIGRPDENGYIQTLKDNILELERKLNVEKKDKVASYDPTVSSERKVQAGIEFNMDMYYSDHYRAGGIMEAWQNAGEKELVNFQYKGETYKLVENQFILIEKKAKGGILKFQTGGPFKFKRLINKANYSSLYKPLVSKPLLDANGIPVGGNTYSGLNTESTYKPTPLGRGKTVLTGKYTPQATAKPGIKYTVEGAVDYGDAGLTKEPAKKGKYQVRKPGNLDDGNGATGERGNSIVGQISPAAIATSLANLINSPKINRTNEYAGYKAPSVRKARGLSSATLNQANNNAAKSLRVASKNTGNLGASSRRSQLMGLAAQQNAFSDNIAVADSNALRQDQQREDAQLRENAQLIRANQVAKLGRQNQIDEANTLDKTVKFNRVVSPLIKGYQAARQKEATTQEAAARIRFDSTSKENAKLVQKLRIKLNKLDVNSDAWSTVNDDLNSALSIGKNDADAYIKSQRVAGLFNRKR